MLRGHQRLPHDSKCTLEIAFDQVGLDPHDAQPAVRERRVTNAVDVPTVLVDGAVYFHDKPARRSEEVHNESAKDVVYATDNFQWRAEVTRAALRARTPDFRGRCGRGRRSKGVGGP